MPRIYKAKVLEVGDRLGVNWDVVSVDTLHTGMKVELEHGYLNTRTNVTNNDLQKTAQIALIHLIEYPDYYLRLLRMEKQADKYWKGKRRRNVFHE
jgi:hypothetical protein